MVAQWILSECSRFPRHEIHSETGSCLGLPLPFKGALEGGQQQTRLRLKTFSSLLLSEDNEASVELSERLLNIAGRLPE